MVTKDLGTPSLASTTLIIHNQTTFVTNSSTILPPTESIDRLSITGIVLVIVGGVTILIGTVMVCAMVLFRNGCKSSKFNKAAQPQNQGIKYYLNLESRIQIAKLKFKNPLLNNYLGKPLPNCKNTIS